MTQLQGANLSNQSFPKSVRLLKPAEFSRVYEDNVYSADDVLVVQAKKNDLGRARMGLSVSRKVGNAVVRNRWKRLIREAFRKQKSNMPAADLIVRPRKGAVAGVAEVTQSIINCVRRIEKRMDRPSLGKQDAQRNRTHGKRRGKTKGNSGS